MKKQLSIAVVSVILVMSLLDSGFAKCRANGQSLQKSPDSNTPNILDNKFTSCEFFGVAQIRYQNYGPKIAVERRILSLPFLQTLFVLNYPDVNLPKRPSKQLMMVDWPIICVSGELYLGNRHCDSNAPSKQIDAKQLRILDTLIFCAYDHETWGQKQTFTEIMRLPLTATAYQYENNVDESSTRLVDLLLVSAYKDYNNHRSVQTRSSILDAHLLRGYNHLSDSNSSRWGVGEVVLLSLANGHKTNDRNSFTILGSRTTTSIFGDGAKNEPYLAAYIQNQTPQSRSWEFLRLPLIGPLWAKWNIEGKESYSGLFPNVIYHKPYQRLKESLKSAENCKKSINKSSCY
jgi:hypothetical protein